MATKDTVVQELVVNTLTHKQFKAAQEAGTLNPYELYGTPDTSVRLPVLTPMWFDHLANDVSWLRADTFSWQSGDMYKAAYEHLVDEYYTGTEVYLYGWAGDNDHFFTESQSPSVGDWAYNPYDDRAMLIVEKGTTTEGYPYIVDENGLAYYSGVIPNIETRKRLDVIPVGGTVHTLFYFLAPDGHKICLRNQESNISALYESTGVAWYYLLDTENKQFKLPRSKHNKYASTLPVVGNGMNIGLTDGSTNYGFGYKASDQSLKGLSGFYGKNVGTSGGLGGVASAASSGNSWGVTKDATKSGIIATQAQDTDQYKYLYFYVGNFTQDAVEQTAGLNAELFNSKADVDLSNMNASQSAKATIIGWGIPDYSAGVVVANNYVTTFPCYAVARHPSNAMNQTGLSIYVDDIRVFSSSNGNSNANKTFCAVCYVGAGHKVSYTGDGTIEMTIYPLIGVN